MKCFTKLQLEELMKACFLAGVYKHDEIEQTVLDVHGPLNKDGIHSEKARIRIAEEAAYEFASGHFQHL